MFTLIDDQILWPIAALLVFITIFVVVLVRVVFLKKDNIAHCENLPLENNDAAIAEIKNKDNL